MSVASRSSSRFSRHRSPADPGRGRGARGRARAGDDARDRARRGPDGAESPGGQRGRHGRRIGIGRAHRAPQPDDVGPAPRRARGHLRDVDRRDDHAHASPGRSGAPSVPAGGHVLIANASGIYASIADATYASGMAATGGSVAIRILGATHRGRRRRLGHDDELVAGGSGWRPLPRPARASSACPAERSAPAPTPTTTPPTLPSASSPDRRTSPRLPTPDPLRRPRRPLRRRRPPNLRSRPIRRRSRRRSRRQLPHCLRRPRSRRLAPRPTGPR